MVEVGLGFGVGLGSRSGRVGVVLGSGSGWVVSWGTGEVVLGLVWFGSSCDLRGGC